MLRSVGVPEVQYLLYVTSVVCARRVSGRVSGLITDARVGPENCVLYVTMQSYCGMPKGRLVHQNWHESQVRFCDHFACITRDGYARLPPNFLRLRRTYLLLFRN